MKIINNTRLISSLLILMLIVMMSAPTISIAATQPKVELLTTSSFAILAGSEVTNTGPTTINGDAGGNVGLYPGTSFTGAADVTMTGTKYLSDAAGVASLAKDDLVTAYNDAAGRTPDATISAALGGGMTLLPGTYHSGSSIQINGTLTLDAQGDPNAVFVFQAGSSLTTATGSSIELLNGARYCRIFWQVGSSATLGTNSHFVGHIFAMQSITVTTGATVQGQLLARNGAVTLDTNTIMNGICATTPTTATLHIIKHVINDNGRTAVAANFNLHVKTLGSDVVGSPAVGVESPGTTYTLAAGTYAVSEDASSLYTVSYSGDSNSSGIITLAAGDNKTITITNNDMPIIAPTTATLHVIKHVINDNGRTAIAANFNLHVKTLGFDVAGSPAVGVESPGTTYTLTAGTYAISEDASSLYTVSYSGDSNSSGIIILAAGDIKTITITNNDIAISNPPSIGHTSGGGTVVVVTPAPATLHIIKHVINDNGRTAVAANFKLHVKALGVDVAGSPASGVETPGTTYKLAAGTYVVNEDSFIGYTASYTGDSDLRGNITLVAGDNKTVTITNNDISPQVVIPPIPATLHVIKHVINDNGRTAVAANFNLHVKTLGVDVSGSPAVGVESPGTTYVLDAGKYFVSEDFYYGYTVSYNGDSNFDGSITLAAGDNKTVTITNNDTPLPTVVTPTVTGGELPKTSTTLYQMLLIGLLLMLIGTFVWMNRKRYE